MNIKLTLLTILLFITANSFAKKIASSAVKNDSTFSVVLTPEALKNSLLENEPMEEPYIVPEGENAHFPGGEDSMYIFLQKNIRYPICSREHNSEGAILVKYYVKKDGTISDIEILRSWDSAQSHEVVRVLKKMPKWVPAKYGNRNVKQAFRLAVTFRLKEE